MKEQRTLHIASSAENIVLISTSLLIPHSKNKTLGFTDYTGDKWAELLTSVKIDGIIHPIVVIKNLGNDFYTVISGHQRLRAAQQLGIHQVPCIIKLLDNVQAERQLITANHLQREYSYPQKLRMASRLLELSEPQKKDQNGKYLPLGQIAPTGRQRERIAAETGLTDHDIKTLQKLKKLPKDKQAATWNFIDEHNPNKTQLKNEVVRLSRENKKVKKQIGKLTALQQQQQKLKQETAKLRALQQKNPGHMHIEQIYDAFQKAQIFMTSELSRIAHLPVPTEACRVEQARMYAHMIVSMLTEYQNLITKKFLIGEENEI